MSLWKHRDFLKLWTGQTVSEIGSRITREGIPMGAVLMMGITPLGMSGLSLTTQLPASLLGLIIGVWVDRQARRPLMATADLLRALLLLLIPLAAWTHHLHLWMFYVVAALSGVFSLLFDVSYQAYLPWLVNRSHLIEANSKLGITSSTAEIIGPGLTGMLVQALTAPVAIVFDAISYIFSAIAVLSIRRREGRAVDAPQVMGDVARAADDAGASQVADASVLADAVTVADASGVTDAVTVANGGHGEVTVAGASGIAGGTGGVSAVQGNDWRRELREGLRVLGSNRILLALAGAAATSGFASSPIFVLDTLYALKTLHLTAWLFGLTVTAGGLGALLGAALSRKAVRRFGVGPTMIATLLIQGLSAGCWVIAGGTVWRVMACLLAWQVVGDCSGTIYEILDVTLRQTLVSDALLGRVNSAIRVANIGLTAIGTLLAGLLGQAFGIRFTMVLATIGMLLASLWIIRSPIRNLREFPESSPHNQ